MNVGQRSSPRGARVEAEWTIALMRADMPVTARRKICTLASEATTARTDPGSRAVRHEWEKPRNYRTHLQLLCS